MVTGGDFILMMCICHFERSEKSNSHSEATAEESTECQTYFNSLVMLILRVYPQDDKKVF